MNCKTRYKIIVPAKYTSEASRPCLSFHTIPCVLRMSKACVTLGGDATLTQALIRCYNCKFQSMQK